MKTLAVLCLIAGLTIMTCAAIADSPIAALGALVLLCVATYINEHR